MVTDVWTSAELLAESGKTLIPVLKSAGVTPVEPNLHPVHNVIEGLGLPATAGRGVDSKVELVLTARGVAASHTRSGSGANTDQCGPQLDSVIEEVTLNSSVVGQPSLTH
jgi:hypothetical protein